MCTRFVIESNNPILKPYLVAARNSWLWTEFMNKDACRLVTSGEVNPSDMAAVIAPNKSGKKSVYPMKWGFKLEHTTLFTVRFEDARSSKEFVEDWKSHRCIIPASYYIERKQIKLSSGEVKYGGDYAIQPTGSTVSWFCGLYRVQNRLPYFVMLTRKSAKELYRINDRMPLLLPVKQAEEWVKPNAKPDELIKYAVTDMVAEKLS